MSEIVPSATPDEPEALGPLASPGAGAVTGPPDEELGLSLRERETPIIERRGFGNTSVAALAIAAVVGVGLGVAAPRLFRGAGPAPQAAPSIAPAATDSKLQVLVETPPPPPMDAPSTPIETLPPGTPQDYRPAPPVRPAPPAAVPAPRPADPDFIAALARPQPRGGAVDPGCAYSAADPDSGCNDPELIQADRELSEAYQAARRAGVPARDLRADARSWRDQGAEAAARSRAALLRAYRARTADVWAMAEAGEPGPDEGAWDGPRYRR